jgi:hypothetical protein
MSFGPVSLPLDFDVTYSFFNDFPPELVADAVQHGG